ncbi:Ras- protein Rap-1b [Rhizophlyctis rosea]|uniref:Ras- protein Rap-1b n=1 Tax=Rhizophlyctis rosea TaxID=64517 RepID=A0AAD5X139_9FUNG|nr:Ras- protein Rap-1b [Rhizophlyctis rosea]
MEQFVTFMDFTRTPPDKVVRALREWGGVEGVLKALNVDPRKGVDWREAKDKDSKRRILFDINRMPAVQLHTFLQHVWHAMQDLTLIMLTVAAVVSLIFGIFGDTQAESGRPKTRWVEFAILVGVIISVGVTSVNDWRIDQVKRKQAAEMADMETSVRRNGYWKDIYIDDIVVGDIVRINDGDIIPVDALVLESANGKVDESSVTGDLDAIKKMRFTGVDESDGAVVGHKATGKPADDVVTFPEESKTKAKSSATPYLVQSGTKCIGGSIVAVAIVVGENSQYGRLLKEVQKENRGGGIGGMRDWTGFFDRVRSKFSRKSKSTTRPDTPFIIPREKPSYTVTEYKLVVLGSSGVGKTALTIRWVWSKSYNFSEEYDPTIQPESYLRRMEFDENHYHLRILDTPGLVSDDFKQVYKETIETAHGFLLVADSTAATTFNDLILLREEILRVKNTEKVPIVLLLNKCDLEGNRVVTREQGKTLASQWGGCTFFETSARKNVNMDEVLRTLVLEIEGKMDHPPPPADIIIHIHINNNTTSIAGTVEQLLNGLATYSTQNTSVSEDVSVEVVGVAAHGLGFVGQDLFLSLLRLVGIRRLVLKGVRVEATVRKEGEEVLKRVDVVEMDTVAIDWMDLMAVVGGGMCRELLLRKLEKHIDGKSLGKIMYKLEKVVLDLPGATFGARWVLSFFNSLPISSSVRLENISVLQPAHASNSLVKKMFSFTRLRYIKFYHIPDSIREETYEFVVKQLRQANHNIIRITIHTFANDQIDRTKLNKIFESICTDVVYIEY